MSSDDWMVVGSRSDGRFGIAHFTGWVEDFEIQDRLDRSHVTYDTLEEATLRAHRGCTAEYGVIVKQADIEKWLAVRA